MSRQILYSQLQEGKRNQWRPRLKFNDLVKRNMNKMDIDKSTWQEKAKVETALGVLSDSHCLTDRLLMMILTTQITVSLCSQIFCNQVVRIKYFVFTYV